MTDKIYERLFDLQGQINIQSDKIRCEVKSILDNGIRLEHLNKLMEIYDNLRQISIEICREDLELVKKEKDK